jgi:hypothetical protein
MERCHAPLTANQPGSDARLSDVATSANGDLYFPRCLRPQIVKEGRRLAIEELHLGPAS